MARTASAVVRPSARVARITTRYCIVPPDMKRPSEVVIMPPAMGGRRDFVAVADQLEYNCRSYSTDTLTSDVVDNPPSCAITLTTYSPRVLKVAVTG